MEILSPMIRYLSRLCIVTVVAFCATLPAPVLQPGLAWIGTSPALADDDDDDGGDDGGDDDDDGGGGSGRGGYSGSRGDDDDSPRPRGDFRGDLRSLFRWPFRQAERAPQRRTVAPPDRVPNEIVAAGLGDQSIANLQQQGFSVNERQTIALTGGELVRLTIPQGMTLAVARATVTAEAPAASVDFNHFYAPEQVQSSPCGQSGCALVRDLVGWPAQPGTGSCMAPQPIGLVDTAINAEHASLSNAHLEVLRLSDEKAPQSGEQHGTAVAALLVGEAGSRAPGLVPAARLVAVDAFQRYRGAADIASVYDLVKALDLLAARDIRVMNLSLSGPHNLLLEHAVGALIDRGAILIAAAGNEGPNAKPVYPAAYPHVIAVTAIDRSMKPYRRAVRGDHIDFAAPGVGVWTAASISGGRHKSGTSFAAPFVTAAASVLLGNDPAMNRDQLEAMLVLSVRDMGDPGKDAIYGWGLLDARALCTG